MIVDSYFLVLLIAKYSIFLLAPDYSFHERRDKNFTAFIYNVFRMGYVGEMHTIAIITSFAPHLGIGMFLRGK